MKRKLVNNIITITNKDGFWIAHASDKEVSISEDANIMRNGIKQHPRLEAINKVAEIVGWKTWVLFNV